MPKEIPQEDIDKLLAVLTPAKESPDKKAVPLAQEDIYIIEGDLEGELNYKGSVRINGRALPGSRIVADKAVTATGGITGADIFAGTGVFSPFIEMSRVICQDDILVTSHMLNCSVRCAGGIYCSAGSFINGGSYRAYYTIQADVFGHPSGSRTELRLVKSDPELTKSYNSATKGDPYQHKLVALQKVWSGSLLSIRDCSHYLSNDSDGPFILDISMMGGQL